MFESCAESNPHTCNAYCVEGGHAVVVLAGRGLSLADLYRVYRKAYVPYGYTPALIRPAPETEVHTLKDAVGHWAIEGEPCPPPTDIDALRYLPYLIYLKPLGACDGIPVD